MEHSVESFRTHRLVAARLRAGLPHVLSRITARHRASLLLGPTRMG